MAVQCSPIPTRKQRIAYTAKPLPDSGFVRLPSILSVMPIGKTAWWAGVKSGKYPAGIKLSERCTVWRVEDIKALIERLSGGA